MLKEVAEVYDDVVLDQAIEHYGLARDQLTLIDSNTDVVYECRGGDTTIILKLIHSSQATREFVCGEVDWVNYLASHDVPVSRPVPSMNGELVEVAGTGSSHFTVVAYEKAAGIHVGYEENEWNADLFQTCGQVVGRMHALAKAYAPPSGATKRPEWHEMLKKRRYPPELDPVYAKSQQLTAHMHTLPRGPKACGMIHGDFHAYNFSVRDAGITVFDFAECTYSWFAHDLAIVVYHVVDLPYLGTDPDGFAGFFMQSFMPAYKRENHLDPIWETEMASFLRLREITTYAYLYSNWDYSDYPEVCEWMEACRYRIDNDIPIVSIDFSFR